MPFAHLHAHSQKSLIDGLARPEEMIRLAKKFGQEAIAITDHGVLSGIPDFYREARREGVAPILGIEAYIVPDATGVGFGPKGNLRDRRNFHLTLLARNAQGYKDLVRLSTWSHTKETFFHNPRMDYDMLRKVDTSNLVCLSGCVMGELQETLLEGIKHIIGTKIPDRPGRPIKKYKGMTVWRGYAIPKWTASLHNKLRKHPDFKAAIETARGVMKLYRSLFPEGHYFYEVMDHGFVLEEWAHRCLLPEARRYGLPVVVTQDSHYGPVGHKELHDLLMAMQWKEKFCGSPDTKKLDICNHKEMYKRVAHLMSQKEFSEAAANTLRVAEMCGSISLPVFDVKTYRIPRARDERGRAVKRAGQLIWKLCEDRMEKLCALYPDKAEVYRERLRFEMSVIKKFGYYHYFLIVADVVQWAKREGILVGAGRGSAAGCLTAYCLGITEIDPIRHGLYFERFLNPDRQSMPDFDTDFQSRHVERVLQYIKDKYGTVERICAYDKLRPKSMLQSMLKALDVISHDEVVKLTKQLEDDLTRTDPEYMDMWWSDVDDKRLLDIVAKSPYDIKGFSKTLFQLPVSVSAHAAGVVIGDESSDLSEWVPTQWVPSSQRVVTQFDMDQIESCGYVKLDVLSIGTLDTLADTFEYIGHDPFAKEITDHGRLEYADKKTYELISSGYTDGMFQLSGGTAKQVIKQIGGCHVFEDIVAVMSLGRPGSVKFAGRYRENRLKDWDDVELAHPDLKELLRSSFGIVLFQEDVMNIVWHLGMPADDLETIMHAIKKKDMKEFAKAWPSFLEHAQAKGWSSKVAKDVWEQIKDYAGYGFNKAHAVSYADSAYKTAFLKANYPGYFIASKMVQFSTKSDAKKKKENLPALVRDARRVGVRIFPPSINKSDVHFTAISPTKIRVGLADIKDVGVVAAREIIKRRPFKPDDFSPPYTRIGPRGGEYDMGAELRGITDKQKCNSGAIMAMAYAGAVPGVEVENRWEAEQEYLYCNVSPHPNQEVLREIQEDVTEPSNLERVLPKDIPPDYKVEGALVGGVVARMHEHKYKVRKGQRKGEWDTMCFLDLEMGQHDFSVVVFADLWGEIRGRVKEGRLVMARVTAEWTEKRGLSYLAERIYCWK